MDGQRAAGGSLFRRRPGPTFATLVLAVPVAVLTVVYVSQAGHWFMEDLQVYRWGGLLARHSGPLYTAQFDHALSFTYPPVAAVVFESLSALPVLAVKQVMIVGSVLALFASAWLACGSAGVRGSRARVAAALAVTDLALGVDPVQQTIDFGQINLLLMTVVLADLLGPGDRWWRGAGVGLATGLKLTPGIFIGYLLLTRRFRAAGTAAAAFALTVAAGFAVLPGPSRQYWLGGLFLDSSRPGPVIYASDQSLLGVIARLAGGSRPALPYWLPAALLVAVCGLLAAARVHRRGRELAAVSVCAVTGLLVSPISWDHHWVWIVPAFVAVADAAWRHRSRVAWAALAALLLVFGAYPAIGGTGDPAQVKGLIWAVPVGGNREYGWHGWQLLAGNLYALAGLAMLCAALVAAFRDRDRDARPGLAEDHGPPVEAGLVLRERQVGRPASDDFRATADDGGLALARRQDVEPSGPDSVDHDPGHLRRRAPGGG
jgi:alpha-1,2-mannosyltransferase